MTLPRSVLCVLALSGALPAEAAYLRQPAVAHSTDAEGFSAGSRVIVVVSDDSPTRAVEASVQSDAGDEDAALVESDAWLHGGAALPALPATDAALALTLFDETGAVLTSFSGTLRTDGRVTLTPDITADVSGACDASARTGCAATSDTSDVSPDIEVLAGEVFSTSTGQELGLDLVGADTYAVAYATITVTESVEVTTCAKDTGGCTTTRSTTTTTAEVGWDTIGAVWEGELTLEPAGLIELKVDAYDARGKRIESAKANLGVPWLDGGAGVNTLATEEDPLTSVAIVGAEAGAAGDASSYVLAVTSSGWSPGESLPVDASVELTNGKTITIPVNSYQRKKRKEEDREVKEADRQKSARITVGDRPFADRDGAFSVEELLSPVCSDGTCVMLVPDGEGAYEASVSVYGLDAAALPDELTLGVTWYGEFGEELDSESVLVEFEEEITAVFATGVGLSEDPIGLDLSGRVSLLGEPNRKGKQSTLAKGRFCGSFSRDADGELVLSGADKDTVSAPGDILVVGEPLAFELLSDDDGDGVIDPPPVMSVYGGPTRPRANVVCKLWSTLSP